jgi:hypothetical protein
MIKIKLNQCKIYSNKLHINHICNRKVVKCQKVALDKNYTKEKLKLIKDTIISGTDLLTEEFLLNPSIFR